MTGAGKYSDAVAALDADLEASVKDLNDLERRLANKIQRLLLQLDTQPGSDSLERSKAALANAVRIRNQVVQEIEREGYRSFRGTAIINAEEAAQKYLKGFDLGEFQPDYTKVTNKILDTVDPFARRAWKESADEVRQLVNQSVNGARSIGDLLEKVGSKGVVMRPVNETLITTLVDGTASLAMRQSLEEMGRANEIKYKYVGSRADKLIRPFCERMLGKVMTIKEIDELDNGQGLDCFVHGGGYNCRHRWVPILDDLQVG